MVVCWGMGEGEGDDVEVLPKNFQFDPNKFNSATLEEEWGYTYEKGVCGSYAGCGWKLCKVKTKRKLFLVFESRWLLFWHRNRYDALGWGAG